ncbi:MAG: universal stress protein [Phenylobacterium sp.]|nr:universal stress protein [Phenylobacterium sp.]
MTSPATPHATELAPGPVKAILLATDLSARSDRALSRAVSLANHWNARLVALHVLRPEGVAPDGDDGPSHSQPADPRAAAERRVRAEMPPGGSAAKVVVADGDVADAILATARQEACDLIVTGVARDDFLGQIILGKPVDRLLRRATAPVLLVRRRPGGAYRNVAIAADLSDTSRPALQAAVRIFPDQTLTLLHAADAPMAGLTGDADAFRADHRREAVLAVEAFLRETIPSDADRDRIDVVVESGHPARVVTDFATERGVDLLVVGTHGRAALTETFLGSVAKDVAHNAPCDTLIVRATDD